MIQEEFAAHSYVKESNFKEENNVNSLVDLDQLYSIDEDLDDKFKIRRLIYAAQHSSKETSLKLFKLATEKQRELKGTNRDTQLYRYCIDLAFKYWPDSELANNLEDKEQAEKIRLRNEHEIRFLNNTVTKSKQQLNMRNRDLKLHDAYRDDMLKLAMLCQTIGNYKQSMSTLIQLREFMQTAASNINENILFRIRISLDIIKIGFYLSTNTSLNQVKNEIDRSFLLLNTFNNKSNKCKSNKSLNLKFELLQLHLYQILFDIYKNNYDKVSNQFLVLTSQQLWEDVNIDKLDTMHIKNVASIEDLFLYASICFLSNCKRIDLANIIENGNQPFNYGICSKIQEILIDFYELKYFECLSKIQSLIMPRLRLDVQIGPFRSCQLFELVHDNCYVHYLRPFHNLSLEKMAFDFNTDIKSVENRVSKLIRSKRLAANCSRNQIIDDKHLENLIQCNKGSCCCGMERIDDCKKIFHIPKFDQVSDSINKNNFDRDFNTPLNDILNSTQQMLCKTRSLLQQICLLNTQKGKACQQKSMDVDKRCENESNEEEIKHEDLLLHVYVESDRLLYDAQNYD